MSLELWINFLRESHIKSIFGRNLCFLLFGEVFMKLVREVLIFFKMIKSNV